MENKTIKEIVVEYLKKNGYGGLYNGDTGCGCNIEEIPLCDYPNLSECKAGYLNKRVKEHCFSGCIMCLKENKSAYTNRESKMDKLKDKIGKIISQNNHRDFIGNCVCDYDYDKAVEQILALVKERDERTNNEGDK